MSRFGRRQSDLFAPPPCRGPKEPDLLAELSALLTRLRAAETLPWPDAAATMAEERRVLALARLAGAQGDELARAILMETERLLAATG